MPQPTLLFTLKAHSPGSAWGPHSARLKRLGFVAPIGLT